MWHIWESWKTNSFALEIYHMNSPIHHLQRWQPLEIQNLETPFLNYPPPLISTLIWVFHCGSSDWLGSMFCPSSFEYLRPGCLVSTSRPVLCIGLFSTFEYFKYQFSKALRDIRALSQIPVTVRKNVSWHFSNAYLSQ